MNEFEAEILEHVRRYPGCGRGTFDTIKYSDVAEEADRMVVAGKLDRWYNGTVPAYYIPGTYRPPHLIADTEHMQYGIIPLASGLHRDGTIHIYVDEKDSGLRIERDDDNMLVIHPGEFARWRIAR